ncbi:hypothetical protein BD413DRAFT_260570 [Trametes elegans]|nr:hypothetical protein BD413DRAFT_260570 [Trametes elegans]
MPTRTVNVQRPSLVVRCAPQRLPSGHHYGVSPRHRSMGHAPGLQTPRTPTHCTLPMGARTRLHPSCVRSRTRSASSDDILCRPGRLFCRNVGVLGHYVAR